MKIIQVIDKLVVNVTLINILKQNLSINTQYLNSKLKINSVI